MNPNPLILIPGLASPPTIQVLSAGALAGKAKMPARQLLHWRRPHPSCYLTHQGSRAEGLRFRLGPETFQGFPTLLKP